MAPENVGLVSRESIETATKILYTERPRFLRDMRGGAKEKYANGLRTPPDQDTESLVLMNIFSAETINQGPPVKLESKAQEMMVLIDTSDLCCLRQHGYCQQLRQLLRGRAELLCCQMEQKNYTYST